MNKGRLYGMRCYLIGAIDRVADSGAGWRNDITPFLAERGVVVLNPCDKPIDIGDECKDDREHFSRLKKRGRWAQLQKEIKLFRVVDLRMVDMSDFLICNIDTNIHTCGTYEELFWANHLKKPVIIHCEQGKQGIPNWLFGVFPHQFFFGNWKYIINYLIHMDTGKKPQHFKRWMYFNYDRLTPEGQKRYYERCII